MTNAVWIFLGGGIGSLARCWISSAITRHLGGAFPFGTLVVNVTGSLAIGLVAGLISLDRRWTAPMAVRDFLMLGVFGGYTTFSSFSLQVFTLLEKGEWLRATVYAGLSVVLCLLAVTLGQALATAGTAKVN